MPTNTDGRSANSTGSHFRSPVPHPREDSAGNSSYGAPVHRQETYRASAMHEFENGRAVQMENPYLGASSGRGKQNRRRTASGSVEYRPAGSSMGASSRRRGNRGRKLAIVAAIVVVLCGVGAFAWFHRPVSITVNGTRMTVTVGTPLSDVERDADLGIKAGNYVSVSGNVIKEKGGTAYTATVNDKKLSQKAAKAFRIGGNEEITFEDGTDITEDYTAEKTEVQPKLTSDGSYGAIVYVAQWGKPGVTERRTGKDSGETTDVVVSEVQDCQICHVNVRPDDGNKYVALTFDDGPSDYTQKYLDVLARYDAKATFFCLGTQLESYPDQAKKIVEAGCQIASHTYSHSQLTTLGATDLQNEISSTFDLINQDTGVSTTVMRPPYGDVNTDVWMNSNGLFSVYVLWNIDTLDWESTATADSVYNAAVAATNGDVILMHDGGGKRDHDVEALPRIIETLQGQGYTFVTIDELMALDSNIPADIASGNGTLPKDAVWPTESAV